MEPLISYFRTIIIFLIFINFVTIMLPDKKYKNYVDFVLGLVLIAIVISPISKIFNFNVSQFTTKNTEQNKYTDNTQYTLQLYETQLSKVVSDMIYNNFNITPIKTVVKIDETDYSKINSIEVTISKSKNVTSDSIYIENIEIGEEEKVENEDIKNIKNLLSSAYNLSADNILISMND